MGKNVLKITNISSICMPLDTDGSAINDMEYCVNIVFEFKKTKSIEHCILLLLYIIIATAVSFLFNDYL